MPLAQAVQLGLEIPGHLCWVQRDLEHCVSVDTMVVFPLFVPMGLFPNPMGWCWVYGVSCPSCNCNVCVSHTLRVSLGLSWFVFSSDLRSTFLLSVSLSGNVPSAVGALLLPRSHVGLGQEQGPAGPVQGAQQGVYILLFSFHGLVWHHHCVQCEEEDLFGVSVPPVCAHGGHDAFFFPVCFTLAHSGHFWPIWVWSLDEQF